MLIKREEGERFVYERIEYKENDFYDEIIMKDVNLMKKKEKLRKDMEIRERGNGYIFVDEKNCKYIKYEELI